MINWQDIEDRLDVHGREMAAVTIADSERADIIEEFESEHTLRRRLASALISLGVRLDPRAATTAASNN